MDVPHLLESASNIGFREKLSYPLLMRNSIIFYQSTEEELLIVRVLHGARDIAALFEEEENN
jgi:hypothetical protein